MMRTRNGAMAVSLMLAACAPAPESSTAVPWRPQPVTSQTYVPSASAPLAASGRTAPVADGQTSQPPRPRRGSSTPPPMLNDPGAPPPVPVPLPPGSEDATARFKQDLMRPDIDRLRHDDALGRLSPFEQRDLFKREQEMYRLENDPLRR